MESVLVGANLMNCMYIRSCPEVEFLALLKATASSSAVIIAL